MKTYEFDLKKYENISGTLKLQIPKRTQRLELISALNVKYNKDGTVDARNTQENVSAVAVLYDKTEKYFLEIDLEYKKGKEKIVAKNYDDLDDPIFDNLVLDASVSILNAGRLGK